MAKEYDLVIIGGGTGGYVAAIRASQLGLKTALVEKDRIGGTCLHKGCIPSKALLRTAEVYATAKRSEDFGVTAESVHLNFAKAQERKNGIIATLYKGVQHLMKKGKIDVYHGIGRILGPSIFLHCRALFQWKWTVVKKMKCLFRKMSSLPPGRDQNLCRGWTSTVHLF